MIELIQFPWSPFCIVQRRILEFSGIPFRITNIPNGDRSLIWKVTEGRYYGVPVVRDGAKVLIESGEESQVIAKYLDSKLKTGLFPRQLEGVQSILWRYIENDIEGLGFKLNDIYWKEQVPKSDQLLFIRHKERKFGKGCIDLWRKQRKEMVAALAEKLVPFEQMLGHQPYLLGQRPFFVDFDLFGILGNYLYSGHYKMPVSTPRLREWFSRMKKIKSQNISREKLRS